MALAAQKNYISLYVCAVVDGRYMAETYADRLGKVNCGKSCIRFKRASDLDLDGMRTLLEDLHARFERGEKLFGF